MTISGDKDGMLYPLGSCSVHFSEAEFCCSDITGKVSVDSWSVTGFFALLPNFSGDLAGRVVPVSVSVLALFSTCRVLFVPLVPLTGNAGSG